MNIAPGRFTLEADTRVEVATAASLEHRTVEGRWTRAPYELREGCAPAGGAGSCRTLVPGAPFTPVSWNGTPCGPCCPDQDPTPIESGVYRLRLTACNDSAAQWSGPSFEMPAATDAVERWRATSNVQTVSAFRLDGTRQQADAADDRHIAGYLIIPGTEVVLSDAGARALSDWLRDARGFSDAVMRRCFPAKRFGFRLERHVTALGLEVSEVAVDLGCQTIELANQEGNLRARSYTYFDNSRQALLAIVREAMPGAVKGAHQR